MPENLVLSPHFNATSSPIKFVSPSAQAYVLGLTSLPGHYAAYLSAPSNVIDVFDKHSLQGVQTLSGHEEGTTSLLTVNNIASVSRPSLVSSGKDGSVKVWDERTNSHSIKMTNLGKPRPLLCCDVSPDGLTVAAGTDLQGDDALILYWDPRQPAAPLRIHSSTHSDDVTALRFPKSRTPSSPNLLLSASSDGLMCMSNADEDDEEEAVLHVGMWGCSISQIDWIHSSIGSTIWAASDMETFSTWSEELDGWQYIDIRDPSVHTTQRSWVTDYLITCRHNANLDDKLGIFVGSNEGDIALLTNFNLSTLNAPWCLHKVWSTGHVGVVRSLLWDEENQVLLTGGEDSKINLWPNLATGNDNGDGDAMNVDSSPSLKRDLDWDDDQHMGKRVRR